MPERPRTPVEFDLTDPADPNRHWVRMHPRLRADHRLPGGWTIHVTGVAYINPRTLTFIASTKRGDWRRFVAVQDYGSSFVEIKEEASAHGPTMFFDAENEPDIARYILKAFDVQWPMGARGVARRPVGA